MGERPRLEREGRAGRTKRQKGKKEGKAVEREREV